MAIWRHGSQLWCPHWPYLHPWLLRDGGGGAVQDPLPQTPGEELAVGLHGPHCSIRIPGVGSRLWEEYPYLKTGFKVFVSVRSWMRAFLTFSGLRQLLQEVAIQCTPELMGLLLVASGTQQALITTHIKLENNSIKKLSIHSESFLIKIWQ